MFRRTLPYVLITMFALFMAIPAAFAVAPASPILDAVRSPLDASKTTISGTTEPNFQVGITGGSANIPPVTANAQGRFSITVGLAQEETNLFWVKAINPTTFEESTQIEIAIVESTEEAAAAEAAGQGDFTAPSAPNLESYPQTLDAANYTFHGTAESGATLLVSGSKTATIPVKANSTFQIALNLQQNATNTFDFVIRDKAGNLSPGTRAVIVEQSGSGIPVTIVEETEEEIVEEIETAEETEEEVSTPTDVFAGLTDIRFHWASDHILELVERGIASGYSDGTFKPDNPINRAEFVKMVLIAFGYEVPQTADNVPFSDVSNDQWFAPYTKVALEEGIVTGYSDGTFKPERTVNRAEAMKILIEAAGIEIKNFSQSGFSDVGLDKWFSGYVMTAHNLGIVNGYENGTFGPEDPMTRGQVAKVIITLLEQL